MFLAEGFNDYKVLDAGDGMKLENWAGHILARPDPQVVWPMSKPELWKSAEGVYSRSSTGGGKWDFSSNLPERWVMRFDNLKFYVKPTGFKHTGLFPEQCCNWRFMAERVRQGCDVLNLFAYTGGATLACAEAGASVVHVDAAKGMVAWAKENAGLSGLAERPIRYIVDDCFKFVQREQRRGRKYDGIVMDPPSYGRGSGGQVWRAEDSLYELVHQTAMLLSDNPCFFIINSYTTGFSHAVTANMLELAIRSKRGGEINADLLAIPIDSGLVLPCGTAARWTP